MAVGAKLACRDGLHVAEHGFAVFVDRFVPLYRLDVFARSLPRLELFEGGAFPIVRRIHRIAQAKRRAADIPAAAFGLLSGDLGRHLMADTDRVGRPPGLHGLLQLRLQRLGEGLHQLTALGDIGVDIVGSPGRAADGANHGYR